MKRVFFLTLALILPLSLLGAKSTEERLDLVPSEAVLPVDPRLGTMDPSSSEVRKTAQALSEDYGLAWTEKWVREDSRYAFAKNYGDVLASLLPQTGVSFASPVPETDGSSVSGRLSDGRIVTVFWRGGGIVAVDVSP